MDFFQILHDLFFDYTLRTVALGAGVLGIVSGALGSFAVLRKQSLLGDAMSHAALPGIVIAFLLTRSKEPWVFMLGAMAAGWLAALFLLQIVHTTRIQADSALGFTLSVFFGLGLMLLTFVQRLPDARQAGLDKYLFGQAAALLQKDVVTMAVLGALALAAVVIFWKEFKLLSFDPEFAASLGLPVRFLDVFLTSLLVVAIVIGLQAVGVVLMSAMVVAPAAAARQWTDRLGWMVALAALFGLVSGVTGAVLSTLAPRLSTGPTIVLVVSTLVLFSMLFARNRGLVWNAVRRLRSRRALRTDTVLRELYALASQHEDLQHAHTTRVLRTLARVEGIEGSLKTLTERGLTRPVGSDSWALTEAGVEQARQLSQGANGKEEVLS